MFQGTTTPVKIGQNVIGAEVRTAKSEHQLGQAVWRLKKKGSIAAEETEDAASSPAVGPTKKRKRVAASQ